jgi:hypothetical protein
MCELEPKHAALSGRVEMRDREVQEHKHISSSRFSQFFNEDIAG